MTNTDRLLAIMARLRDPVDGCPWDIKQTFESIAPYTLEEVHEVLDAIRRGNMADLRDELGDLLLQVVFHSRIAEESDYFNFDDVAGSIANKLERRHPHVFESQKITSDTELHQNWNQKKQAERAAKQGADVSVLSDIPPALPALMLAVKLQERAASVGFDWPDRNGPMDKIHEELVELKTEIHAGDMEKMADELGDLLFSICNLARHLKLSPEICLLNAAQKFKTRFESVETNVKRTGKSMQSMTIDELEHLWQNAKKQLDTI